MSNKKKLQPILPHARKIFSPLWKYKPVENIINPHEVVDLLTVTARTPPWQRAGGPDRGGGWDIEHAKRFVVNWFYGNSDTDIINVDLVPSLKYARTVGCQKTITYYKDWIDQGLLEASIDGHHQSSWIDAFMQDKLAVDLMGDGNEYKYSDLHEDDQAALTQKCARHRKLQECLFDDAVTVFDIKNDAVATKPWQKFMSNQSDAIEWIGDRTNEAQSTPPGEPDRGEFYSLFHLAFTPYQCDKEQHTELVCKLGYCFARNFDEDLNLRQVYTLNYFQNLKKVPSVVQSRLDIILKEMKKEADALFAKAIAKRDSEDPTKKKKPVLGKSIKTAGDRLIWGLVQYVKLFQGYETADGRKFYDWWTIKHHAMVKASGEVNEDNFKKGSYKFWVNRSSDGWALRKILCLWSEALKACAPKLLADGVIRKLPSQRKGRFTMAQKIRSLLNNEMMDINGVERGVSDFLLGNLVGGHAISDANGGPSTQDNCLPEPTEDNRSHGKENVPAETLKDLPIAKHLKREIFEQEEEPVNRNEKII